MTKLFTTRRTVTVGEIWRDEKCRTWRVLSIESRPLFTRRGLEFLNRFMAQAEVVA